MTIKEEIMGGLERLAATFSSKKITVILCCESNTPEPTTFYQSVKSTSDVMVMTVVTGKKQIKDILTQVYNETQASHHRP